MKKAGLWLGVVFFFGALGMQARGAGKSDIQVIESKAYRQRQQLCIDILLDYSELSLPAKGGLKIYPVLIGRTDTLYLPPIWLAGKVEDIVPLNRRKKNKLNYNKQILFSGWMYGSRLELRREHISQDKERKEKTDLFLNYIPLKLKVSFLFPSDIDQRLSVSGRQEKDAGNAIIPRYPENSLNFKYQVFLSFWLYPGEAFSRSNMGALALQANDWEGAYFYLEAIKKDPFAQNNWGILLFNEGKMEEALHFFEEADSNGCREALYNRKQVLSALHNRCYK